LHPRCAAPPAVKIVILSTSATAAHPSHGIRARARKVGQNHRNLAVDSYCNKYDIFP